MTIKNQDVNVLVDVARCDSRREAVVYATSEAVLAGLDVKLDESKKFLALTRDEQNERALAIADAAEQSGHRGLALAWRLIWIQMMPAIGWPERQNYVKHAITMLALTRTRDAMIARDRLRAWRRVKQAALDAAGGDLFAAAAAHCDYADGNDIALSVPLKLLMTQNRWDVALEFVVRATGVSLEHLQRAVPLELAEPPGDDLDARNSWQKTAEDFADAIMQIGHAWSGALSLAWRMMLCEPDDPRSFSLILPQLKWMLDGENISAEQRTLAEARLAVWHAAAVGKHLNASVSIWRLAALATKNMSAVDADAIKDPTVRRDLPDDDVAGPSVVVLTTEGANVKSLPFDWKKLINKKIPLVVAHDVASITATLRAEYPHAWREIGMLVQDLRDDKPVWMRPVILLGDPGSGKSRLVRRLAELLSLYVNRHDAASSMDGMFAGTTKGWSSAQPSVPANAVLAAQHANPIVMIDEIEKASESTQNGNLWNVLTPLLERETSARYRDKGIDSQLDLSHVSYIATANSVERLPSPLRDRFRIIRIPNPTLQHLPVLAANVLRDIARDDEERAHEPPLAADELAIIGRVWEREKFSMRKLQRLIAATLEARDLCAMRH